MNDLSRRHFFAAAMQASVPLDTLKPSKRDLDHGLELHREALVIDAYGFAPRCALDGDAMKAAVEGGASDVELQDMQEDQMMTRCVENAVERAEFLRNWQTSGVTCIFQNAGEEGSDPMRLIKRLAHFTYVTDMLHADVSKALRAADVEHAKKQNRLCMLFSGNGVPLTQQWVSVPDELRYIGIFYQLGIRMMHLTYNRRNVLGDGCAESANGGLSDLGRAAIAEMNRIGVMVDVAHSGWQTSLEAAKASRKPMVASHTTCTAVNRHIRSKPDEVIRAIADTGGYIGICCIPGFVGKAGDINAMLDHIVYAVKRFGAEHVAIGTDTATISANAAAESRKIPRRARGRTRYEALWPAGSMGGPGTGGNIPWSAWPLYTVGMVQRGIADDDIRKILGGNVLRVLGRQV